MRPSNSLYRQGGERPVVPVAGALALTVGGE